MTAVTAQIGRRPARPGRGAAVALGILVAATLACGVGYLRLDSAQGHAGALESRLHQQESRNVKAANDAEPLRAAAAAADEAAAAYAVAAREELLRATALAARIELFVSATLGSRHEEAESLLAEVAALRGEWEQTPAVTDAAADRYRRTRESQPPF